MGLITLVYVSFAWNPMSDDELREILDVSRKNNQALDITGMLLYRDGFFMQALEGETDAVENLFEKIKKDPRHRNTLRVYSEPIKKRSFEDWSMGFNKFDIDTLEQIEGYTNFLKNPDLDFFAKQPSYARTLLNMFRTKSVF